MPSIPGIQRTYKYTASTRTRTPTSQYIKSSVGPWIPPQADLEAHSLGPRAIRPSKDLRQRDDLAVHYVDFPDPVDRPSFVQSDGSTDVDVLLLPLVTWVVWVQVGPELSEALGDVAH